MPNLRSPFFSQTPIFFFLLKNSILTSLILKPSPLHLFPNILASLATITQNSINAGVIKPNTTLWKHLNLFLQKCYLFIFIFSNFSKYYLHPCFLVPSFLPFLFTFIPSRNIYFTSMLPVKFPESWPPSTLSHTALHFPPAAPLLLIPKFPFSHYTPQATSPTS